MNRRQSPRRATSSTWPGLRRPRQPYSACHGVYTPGRPRGTVGVCPDTHAVSRGAFSALFSRSSDFQGVRAPARDDDGDLDTPKTRPHRQETALSNRRPQTWLDSWGPRVEHLLRNALFALLEQPEATLGDIGRLLHDPSYRERAVERVTNRAVRSFWKDEYAEYSKSLRSLVVAPLENKLGAFLTDPKMRSVLAEGRQSLDLRRIMDEGKVLLVNLSKGRLGEGPAMLLGSLLVAHISLHGLARAELPEERRRDFFLYLDEFQTFATKNLTAMLSELRKYRVSLVLANQYLDQLDPEIRHAILGNVGTLITFRVGPTDARILAQEFAPEFEASDLTNLPSHEIYVRLMVEGSMTRPFSGETVKL
jgi:Type IV secretion-system coupling protein DNA-binding domain